MTETPQQAAIDDFMAHNDESRHIYALTLDGKTHLVSTDEAAAEELRARGIRIARADDEQAMAPLLAVMHPQGRGLMEGGLARSLERLGRAAEIAALFSSLPDVVASDPAVIAMRPVTFGPFRDNRMSYWDVTPPTMADLYPSTDPNEGRQAPPRREWWTEQWKGKGTPGLGCQKQDKRARKAQKLARKANRSRK